VDAVLYAFHPGSLGGPAIVDLLFGDRSPSGKLTVTFPKVVGHIPIYYNHKNTGRPPRYDSWVHIDSIGVGAWQTSLGNESHYLDAGFEPQFPFGFGLAYTTFEYSDIRLSSKTIKLGSSVEVSATVTNTGSFAGDEIVQLYVRDVAGDITRPVKELKGFRRIGLKPGESKRIVFEITSESLAFHNQKMELVTEPGVFHVWIGTSSVEGLMAEFEIVE
jgi:beta-glucosidase